MRLLYSLLLLSSAISLQAQTSYNKFQWQTKPVIHTVDKAYEDESAVYITDERINEYVVQNDGFFQYRTMHRIVHINNDKGIESFNRIYLPFDEGIEMMDVKARTILPNGKIVELDKNNVKDWKEEDGQYKIFALDGLTKGCEVEYYFILKKNASVFGREVLSSKIPAMNAHFELIFPKHLAFETKSFNDLPDSKDTIVNDKKYMVINDTKINGAEEEKYSMYQANLKRVEYKLSYNLGKNATERMYTWNELAKKAYAIYSDISDKDYKKLKELSGLISTSGSEIDKVVAIENYLKKNFITRKDIDDTDADDLVKVIKNKVASHQAIVKMYIGLLTLGNINFQLVLTGDRENYVIDRKFENWNNAANILLYFPSTKKFIAPTEMEYRYPWIPPSWAACNGIFCVTTTIGNFTTAIGEIRFIPLEDVAKSYVNMDVALSMSKNDTITLNVKHIYGGYAASNYKLPFVFLPEDQQRNVLKEMIKFGTNSENILSNSFENKEMEQDDPYKPFIINATVKSANLTERAGEKIILKIGEIIGEQAEMYDTKPRATPVDLQFPHLLIRNIVFTIPEGYQIKNLQDLNTSSICKEGDKEMAGFVSSYSSKENEFTIQIREFYNQVSYSKSLYESFKKVINAAADFNKVVLILDKN